MYTIRWELKSIRQFERIKDSKQREQLSNKIDNLMNFPHCGDIKMLANHKYDFRLRVGRYRVLFNVNKIIKIISIEEVVKRDDQTY